MRGELHRTFRKFGILGLALVPFSGAVLAQEPMISRSRGYQRVPARQDTPVSVQQQQYYDNSGTAGRMGLGASPFHPEGPGNFSHR